MVINTAVLTISDSTIQENTASRNGGGIFTFNNVTAFITGTDIMSNTADIGGGVRMGFNAVLHMENSVVQGNMTVGATDAGGMHLEGAATIIGSAIHGNSGGNNGGGILKSSSGPLVISDTDFISNTSPWGGGLIVFSSGSMQLDNVNFIGNDASNHGGAMYYASSGNARLSNSQVLTNSGSFGGAIRVASGQITMTNILFENNQALSGAEGGALYNAGGNVWIYDSEFRHNNATSNGGAIRNQTVMVISNTLFYSNTANSGGAMITWGNPAVASTTVMSSTFQENRANNNGGAIFLGSSPVYLEDVLGFDNVAGVGGFSFAQNRLEILNATIRDNSAGTNGGVYLNAGASRLVVSGTQLLDNRGNWGGTIRADNGAFTMTNSIISGSVAPNDDGGAIYNGGGVGLIENSTLQHNSTSVGDGGAIRNNQTLTVRDTTIFSNTAASDGGGLIVWNSGTTVFENVVLEENQATSGWGGGVFIGSGSLDLTNGDVLSNSANGLGGGIYNQSTLSVTNGSRVEYNQSNSNGGALYNNGSGAYIEDSSISFNEATNEAGGIINVSGGLVVVSTVFQENNSINSIGGAIANWNGTATAVISDSQFLTNTARTGAGTLMQGGLMTITNSLYQGNQAIAGSNSGGVHAGGGTLLIIDGTTFRNNMATGNGGGLSVFMPTEVSNSTFNGNEATSNGGGIFSSNSLSLANVTISGNEASTNFGGGIHVNGSTTTLVNVTITDNTAASLGGGVMNFGTLNVQNSIIANSISGGDCFNSATVNDNGNNIVEDNSCGFAGGADPLLEPLADNGGPTLTHALLAGSPALDAGNNAACAAAPVNGVDQRGILRPLDGDHDSTATCDIGAYEYNVFIWDGGGGDDDWSTPANWVGDLTIPGAQNEAVFNGTSSTNALVDGAFPGDVYKVTVTSDYSATISLTRALDVGGDISLDDNGTLFLDTHSLRVGEDVTLADGALLNVGTGSLSVEGSVNNNGELRQTVPATVVSTPVDYLHIFNDAGTVQKYYGLTLTPTGGSLGDVEVRIHGNQPECTTHPIDPLMDRCFDISPTTVNSATIRFYFTEAERNGQDANNLVVWHHVGAGGWVLIGDNFQHSEMGTSCLTAGGMGCWLQADNIDDFSPFGLAGATSGTPTAISLRAISINTDGAAATILLFVLLSVLVVMTIFVGRRRRTWSD